MMRMSGRHCRTRPNRRHPLARRLAADERGAIIVFIAVSLMVILGMAGLAIDLGRAYLEDIRLGRAVDAGVLAGAKSLRLGQSVAQQQALAVAKLNGAEDGVGGVTTTLSFGTNALGENTVSMSAVRTMPTIFMRVLGHDAMTLRATAEAAVPPVDLVLLLDQSGSLATQNAWDDLQAAAKAFVQHFDDAIDQVGLVSFQLRGTDRVPLGFNFTSSISTAVDAMNSAGDTNTGEGLRLAWNQLQSVAVRSRSAKVVVFFTDGRPTAFRGNLGPAGGEQDRAMAVSTVLTGNVRGYFDDPDNLPMDALATPDGCGGVANCWGWTEAAVRDQGKGNGELWANQIRNDGVLIYSIALGNPSASDPILQPDLTWLQYLSNEGGVADGSQPQGRAYFAPSAAQLQLVFDQVAQDLLVRLAK